MRVIIVGVGGVGAMAAWRLVKAGVEVIALERFQLDHDQGSSYGDSRIVRRVYPDPLYTALMADAYALWDELQAQFPHELITRAGGIFFGKAEHPHVHAAQAALEASGVECEALDAKEVMRRFPAFRLQPDEIAVYEPSMGYARASKCVSAAAQLARKLGANIVLAHPVEGLESKAGGGVRVTVQSGETFEADRLLLTAGAWTGPILEKLGVSVPLAVTRQPYIHLEPTPELTEDFQQGRFPTWIDASSNTYGFPLLGDVPGVKIGLHDHGVVTAPETVDREVREADIQAAWAYAEKRFYGLTTSVVYKKVCLYTNTPDEDFLLDALPGLPGAFVISACSGHGFKFTPLMGQIAADIITETPISYDLSRFRLSRFA